MDEETKQELKKQAFQFMTRQPLGIIATVASDNTPEAATVSFFIDLDWSIYIQSHYDSRKVKNITTNQNIAFVIGTTLIPQTLQMQGTADILEVSHPEFQIISQKIKDSGRLNLDPIINRYSENYVIIRIHITWLRYLTFNQTTSQENYSILIP